MKKRTLIGCLMLITCFSFAQTRNFKVVNNPTDNPTHQQRKAVVIGMSDYGEGKSLHNTLRDADDMAEVFTRLGFVVTLLKDNNLRNLKTHLNNWFNTIERNDVVVFYFAGHGVQVNGTNYLIPVDTELQSPTDVEYNTLCINWVLSTLANKRIGMKLIILDACRDNPFTKSWNLGNSSHGLASMTAPPGSYIAFAAAPGAVAEDRENLSNGVFTHFLKQEITKEGVPIDIIFTNAAKSVCEYTNHHQRPFRASDLTDLFYFIPPSDGQPLLPETNRITNYTETANGLNLEMIAVHGGTFTMGFTGEPNDLYHDDEKPAHQVTVGDFYIGKFPVTQKQWMEIMGNNPSYFKGDDLPVESVSWYDAQEFIYRLNYMTGNYYRLPTEAEWEYAARGGALSRGYKYSGSNHLPNTAWFTDNSNGATHPVGAKIPNELGIYDMSGNVWEWCSDWYGPYSALSQLNPMGASSGASRVYRGGSWYNLAQSLRVSNRGGNTPSKNYSIVGFRLACSPK